MAFHIRPTFQALLRLVLIIVVISNFVNAGKKEGIIFPETVILGDRELVLNGTGLREATVFKVTIYAIALYLEQKSRDASTVIGSEQNKKIVMHFVRNATKEDILKGWQSGFHNNYGIIDAIRPEYEQFLETVEAMNEGGTIEIEFVEETVNLYINNSNKLSVENPIFQQALLSVWLGPHPPNQGLKRGILGK